jgi:hypothetical protein
MHGDLDHLGGGAKGLHHLVLEVTIELPAFARPRSRNVNVRPPASFASRRGGFGAGSILALSPVAWFRSGMGIATATGVSQWDDQSGNARHLKQATGAAQPALQGDGSILFNGTGHFLKCDAFTLNQPETIYFLGRQVTWTLSDRIFDGETAGTGALLQVTSTPTLGINAGAAVNGNTNLAVNTYGVVAAVFNGGNSVLQVNRTAPLTGNAGAGNMGGFTLGASGGGGSLFGNIQVKEIIIFPTAHDSNTRLNVIRYLSDVGGLAV